MQALPVHFGHFWIEYENGEIFDPHFEEYNVIADTPSCTKIHLPAPISVQKEILSYYSEWIMSNDEIYDKLMQELGRVFKKGYKFGMSWQNTLYQKKISGGTIVFGSMGFITPNGFRWIYGDEDWTFIEHFVHPQTISIYRTISQFNPLCATYPHCLFPYKAEYAVSLALASTSYQ